MEYLLKQQPRVIAVDTKGDLNWKGYYLTSDPFSALNPDIKKVIVRIPEGEKVPNDFWTRAMRFLQSQGGGIIYIDEMPMITNPNWAPPGLKDVFRIGGGIGVGVYWSAQEATGVANTIIRQSEVLALFHNHGASDRDKIAGVAGDIAEVTKALDLQEFVVYESYGVYNEDVPVRRVLADA